MARRSHLLLLLLLPVLALLTLYWLDEEPRATESVANVEIAGLVSEAPVVSLAAAAAPRETPVQAVAPFANRRVRVAARIEGRIAYSTGTIPGGKVLVYAGLPGALWRWERAGRRIHLGLDADTLVHGFADTDGRFALEWTGDRTELAVAAMAPTAATETTVRWRAADTEPLTLILEPRAALFVDVRGGAGFDAASAPSFRGAELRLRLPSTSDERASGIPAARRNMSGWVDEEGRASFLAVAVDRDFEVSYRGPAALETGMPVSALSNGERRAMVLELAAGARLVGRVVDESGAPVAGASLVVRKEQRGMEPNALAYARSDTGGRFDVQRVPLGAKVLEITKDGFPATEIRLGADLVDGVRRDLGDVLLESGISLSGQVREPDGRPAAGAKVTAAINTEIDGPKPPSFHWRHSTADAEGRFAFSGLPKGFHFDLVAERRVGGSQAKGYRKAVRGGEFDVVVVLELSPALVGRVVTPSGEPKPFAEVRAMSEGNTVNPWEDSVSPTVALADKDGNFRLELDELGTVWLEARARGFAPSPTLAANVPSNIPVELRLRPALSVLGTVVDAMGQPVRGASVGKLGEYDGYATSGADGRFEIADQGAGELVLVARHPNHAPSEHVLVELGDSLATPEIELTLRRGATVRGVLYRKGERAGPGAEIIADTPLGANRKETFTNEAGEFGFDRLSPGRWTIMSLGTLRAADARTEAERAAVGAEMHRQTLLLVDGGEYQLTLGPTAENPVQVRGVVRSAGQELPRCRLFFVHAGDGDQRTATVDHAGRYEVVLPRPGGYRVTALGGGGGSMGTFVHLRCEIPGQPTHELDLYLPGGTIRGQVLGSDGAATPYVLVSLHREDGVEVGAHGGGRAGVLLTDDRGRYEFPLLISGHYRVAAGGKGFAGFPEAPPPSGRVLSTTVLLRDNEVKVVDLKLANPGEVHGRVRDGSGKPVASAWIFARDSSGTPLDNMGLARTDPTGRFEWSGFAPGDYTFQAKGGQLASAESARVTVRAGAVAQVELVVTEGAYLIVGVEGADLAELAQGLVRVDVRDANNGQVLGLRSLEDLEELTGGLAANEQRFGPLPPGSYRVSAMGSSGKRAEGTVELKAGDEQRLTLVLKE